MNSRPDAPGQNPSTTIPGRGFTPSERRILAIALVWTVGNLSLSVLLEQTRWSGLPPVVAVTLVSTYIAQLLAEALLLSVSLEAILHLGDLKLPVTARRLLRLTVWSVVAGALAFVCLGWILARSGLGFPKATVVVSVLRHWTDIAAWTTGADLVLLGATAAVGWGIALLVRASVPRLRPRERRRLFAGGCVATLLAVVLLRGVSVLAEPMHRERAVALATIGLGPTSTLWSSVSLGENGDPPMPDIELEAREPERRAGSTRTKLPHILVIAVESLRGGEEMRHVDGEPVMPVVSRLAREGVHFTRAYAPSNESAYSMVGVMTSNHLLKRERRDDFRSPSSPYVRIPDLLADTHVTGFFSASPERWQNMKEVSWSPRLDTFFDASSVSTGHLAAPASDIAFHAAVKRGLLQTGGVDDRVPTEALRGWMRGVAARPDGKPFFAMIKYDSSHFPYELGHDVPRRFTPSEIAASDWRSVHFFRYPRHLADTMRRRYWNSLSYIDAQIASLLSTLREIGALDNTVVVVFGDHGQVFHENGEVTHAARLSEGSLNSGFVVWGSKWGRRVINEPVSLLDIGPLVLSVAGLPPYRGFQGQIPASLDPSSAVSSRPIFSVAQSARFEESVLLGRWRYVRQAQGLYQHLYDVIADPHEAHDRVRDEPSVVECLHRTLTQFRRNQLGYHARPELAAAYYPPRHTVANVAACKGVQ